MTYETLKFIATGLLTGDNVLPASEDVLQGLVSYALTTVATKADSLHLMTLNTSIDVLRLGQGNYLIRNPDIPEDDVDELDIDEELCFAVARYLCSYLSKEKGGIHAGIAERIILDYNAKVYEFIEQTILESDESDLISTPSDCVADSLNTEFTGSCDTEFTL